MHVQTKELKVVKFLGQSTAKGGQFLHELSDVSK